MSDDEIGRYLRDLVRAGCRVTITPVVKPFRGVEIKGERLSEPLYGGDPEPSRAITRCFAEAELDNVVAPGLPFGHAIRELARDLAESI